jgi:hypothetical protein
MVITASCVPARPGVPSAGYARFVRAAARQAREAVSGFWLNIPGHGAGCPACRASKAHVGVHTLLELL